MAVVTQPDKRRGRGNQLVPSPVKALAEAHPLPVWQPHRIKKDKETLQNLRSLQADAFVVVAYGQILSQEILDMPRLGCINAHGSILPRYRGAAPIQWCLYHGEVETGITTMQMDAGMDTGPMLLEVRTPIALLENANTLGDRLAELAAGLLVETLIKRDANQIQAIPQNEAEATYAPLIKKPDYVIDWTRPAIALHNQVRGFFPNCTATFRDRPLKITATVPLMPACQSALPAELQVLEPLWSGLDPALPPGTLGAIAKGWGPIFQTGEGWLLLQEIQLPGKRPQSGLDFANGTRLAIGDRLGNGQVDM